MAVIVTFDSYRELSVEHTGLKSYPSILFYQIFDILLLVVALRHSNQNFVFELIS